ncbi:hypothetical protein ALC60_04231 [Trachymyrmex zeteki]|uniref:Uncharacterized protein n=1 Tax=Mycetomoellerius zeteki TaxID=64791 RepID=A0A151X8Z3_9HYME|nr:hypothetical protein ALC60_04231 [Trachymyrmex zeteki]
MSAAYASRFEAVDVTVAFLQEALTSSSKIPKSVKGICCGFNEHPDSQLFIQMYKLVSTYSLVKPPKDCNISGGELMDVLLSIKDIKDPEERQMSFLCKKFNNDNNTEKERIKEKRKSSKLSHATDTYCNNVESSVCSVQNAAHTEIMMGVFHQGF